MEDAATDDADVSASAASTSASTPDLRSLTAADIDTSPFPYEELPGPADERKKTSTLSMIYQRLFLTQI